jgi:hypothetical protein
MLRGAARSRLADRAEGIRRRLNLAFRPSDLPVLLGISYPKSGTHLLQQILLGFSETAGFSRHINGYFPPHPFFPDYERLSGRSSTPPEALAWLDSLRPGDVASTHLYARPEAVERVSTVRFAPYFLLRDPRDVLVSHVFYVTEMDKTNLRHSYYTSLPDFDARLAVSIVGQPEEVEFPNFADAFAPYLGWLEQPAVLTVRFEDLIENRAAALDGIIEHLLSRTDLSVPRQTVREALIGAINPKTSATFRSGKSGEWRQYFSKEHKRLFKDVAGTLLIDLGYERDLDW